MEGGRGDDGEREGGRRGYIERRGEERWMKGVQIKDLKDRGRERR